MPALSRTFWTSFPGRMGRTDPQVSLHGFQLHLDRETGKWPSTWSCRQWLSTIWFILTPLRSLHDRHFRLGSSFDSSSSTQHGVMRHHSPGWQHLLCQGTNRCLQSVTPARVLAQGLGLGQATFKSLFKASSAPSSLH